MSKVVTRSQAKLLLKLQEEKEKLEQELCDIKVAKAVINILEGTKDEELEFFHHFKVLNNIDRDLHRMKMSDKDFEVEIKELTKERMELWTYLLDSQLNCLEKRRECQKLTKKKKDRRLLLEILMRKL
ncbi:hypothetical protein PYW07_010621 [Mythimna separata]|uniref:Uncharacterized protein n=1 Tax=Mythimna separata TaxID=271217 RepID=A0AAD8DMJ4_MYTSE|nr:hypothetical protein PYW07_010621 [Mythimna separata]